MVEVTVWVEKWPDVKCNITVENSAPLLALDQAAVIAREWLRLASEDEEMASDTIKPKGNGVSYAEKSPFPDPHRPLMWNELVGCDECTAVRLCTKHAMHVNETMLTMQQWSKRPSLSFSLYTMEDNGKPLPCPQVVQGLMRRDATPYEIELWKALVWFKEALDG